MATTALEHAAYLSRALSLSLSLFLALSLSLSLSLSAFTGDLNGRNVVGARIRAGPGDRNPGAHLTLRRRRIFRESAGDAVHARKVGLRGLEGRVGPRSAVDTSPSAISDLVCPRRAHKAFAPVRLPSIPLLFNGSGFRIKGLGFRVWG